MKTITPVLWSRLTTKNEKRVFVRITENRKSIYKSLGISVKPSLWNSEYKRVSKTHPDHKRLNEIIENEIEIIRKKDVRRKQSKSYLDYHKYYKEHLREDQKFGSYKKFNTVYGHLTSFKDSLGKPDITFDDIDKDFLKKLKSFLTKRNIGNNSQKTYFKQIKYLLKEAIKEEKYIPNLPLDTIFPTIKPDIPKPTSLSKDELIKIINQKNLIESNSKDLGDSIEIFNSINFFLFSFFSYGMRFGDLSRLKWGNIRGDIKNQKLYYKMTKTKKDHTLNLFDPLVEILRYYLPTRLKILYLQNVKDVYLLNYLSDKDKFFLESDELSGIQTIGKNSTFYSKPSKKEKQNFNDFIQSRQSTINIESLRKFIMIQSVNNPNDYIFPILNKSENDIDPDLFYKQVESKLTVYNHNLDRIRKRCGITKKLTSHVARHTFSFISLREGASLFEISTSLNHQELSTTQSYLRGDSSFVDESISEIYNNLFKKKKN